MIRLFRELPPADMKELLRMFHPESMMVADDELWETLVVVLKRDVLQVRDEEDLPLALRRRLTEVAVDRFQLFDSADSMTDIELAFELADFLLQVSSEVDNSDEDLAEFNRFFRTKKSLKPDETLIDTVEMNRDVESVYAEILAGLDPSTKRDGFASDRVSSGIGRLQRLGASSAGHKTLSVLGPNALGALAGAAFMAGFVMKDGSFRGVKEADSDSGARGRRARNSKLVQNVVKLSVFAVKSIGDPGRSSFVVRRHLRELGYDFRELDQNTFEITKGSAKLVIAVSTVDERSLISISSHVGRITSHADDRIPDLLALNYRAHYGQFAWDPDDGSVSVGYELLGDTLDLDELGFALSRVADIADTADDILERHSDDPDAS